MASVNKVILVGNLGADPEIKSFQNGGKVATLRIATTEHWNDRQSGEKKEITDWHTVVLSNGLADIAERYLRKGSSVYVEGKLRTRSWEDQNGQKRYITEVRADNIQMLGGRPQGGQGGGQQGGNYGGRAPAQQQRRQPRQQQPQYEDDMAW